MIQKSLQTRLKDICLKKLKMKISHSKPTINEQDRLSVMRVLNPEQLTNYEEVSKFEQELSDYIGQKNGIAVNSGTNALYLALLSLELEKNDEVIIPSFSCIALLNAISYTKAKPKIVDINEDDYNISLDKIKKDINKKTKAIIAPHMFGDGIRNIEEIVGLGIPVIEDCALSIGANINGKKVGSFSDLSIFSFYSTKVMATGQGGMVLSSSKEKLKKMKDFMQYDNRKKYHQSFNYRLTDFQAALGRSQLSRLEQFIDERRNIAKIYNRNFKNVKSIKIPERTKESIFFRYILEVNNVDNFIREMSKKGIGCAKPIYKPLHYYFNLDKKYLQNTEKSFKGCVSIPIYPLLKESEINCIIKTIKN